MRRWALAIVAAAAPRAWADSYSTHLIASGDAATTDNVFSAPSNRDGDLFFQLRPGVLFAYDAPRMIHELDAEVEVLEYTFHSTDPSVTFHGGWKANFLPSPRSDVTVVANASTGKVNAIVARTAPDQTGIAVTPTGSIDQSQADGSEFGSWQATKSTRVSQTGFARWATTDDNMGTTTSTEEAGGGLGFERSFDHDTVGLEAGGSVLRLERIAPATAAMGSTLNRQVDPRGTLVWRHDINKRWSVNADGGLVYVMPYGVDPYNPTVTRRSEIYPVFGGLLAYSEPWGRAALDVHRSVSPNLFIAQNTVDDSAILQLAMPLPWPDDTRLASPKLVALGSLGAEQTQLIAADSSQLVGTFKVARLDVGVGYTPSPGITYGVRYEFIYQTGDSTATMLIPSYYRNTLFFTFSVRYPDRMAAQVQPQTKSVRSDRSDLSPNGGEPVVPEAPEEQGGE